MKTILFTWFLISLINQWVSANSAYTDKAVIIGSPPNKVKFIEMVGRRLKDIWARYTGEENKDTFIGRCFGVAKKLRFIMPLIIFKLGVIVTTLAFLTIFSLKSLGLLGLLLLINVSGAISKIAAALSGKHGETKIWRPPQTVHFHIHKENEEDYHIGHTGSGWDDRMNKYGHDEDLESLESYNLYNKLSSNLLGSYGRTGR